MMNKDYLLLIVNNHEGQVRIHGELIANLQKTTISKTNYCIFVKL